MMSFLRALFGSRRAEAAPTLDLILVGGPGSGKGTQAEKLCAALGLTHISTGDLFRDHVARATELGARAKPYMDRGELVPDELVVAVVEERFQNPAEVEPGFVLDGFPRTEHQAFELDRILVAQPLDVVIDIDVPTDIAVDRMRSRGREDDTEESIRRRLELYDAETLPLTEFYRARSLLVSVDGLGTEDEVQAAMLAAVASRLPS